jgi:hypothetical protein
MSNGFGIDIYGEAYYGYSQPAEYSVAPFVANQTGYGEITLTWSAPNSVTWKYLNLVRSIYGYPASVVDGVSIAQFVPSGISKSYDDPGLNPGTIYYYTMFITIEAPTWASGTTYNLNNQVLYNGLYWASTENGNVGHTPVAGSTYWTPSMYIPTWYPAGYAGTLALMNQGYSTLLYNRTPQPYKIVTSDTFANTAVDNPALASYLSLFGFGLDMVKGAYDSYLNLNDPDVVSATSLDILGQQLGINTDYLSTPQQRRQRIKNAAINYRMKGQTQSIHNIIADLTGWDSTTTYGPNMLNSPDQSDFPSTVPDTWNVNSTYFLNNIIQYNGYSYKCLTTQAVGQVQAPTGTSSSNTWWSALTATNDTVTYLNPETNSYSTWSSIEQAGTSASITGVMNYLPHPTNTAINNWKALTSVQTNSFETGNYSQQNTSPIYTPNYSSSVNYVVNNYVLYTDGYYYVCTYPNGPGKPDGVITPGTNNTYWQAFYYVPGDTPNTIKDGIPIPQLPTWSSTTSYTTGTQVQYQGIIYQAATNSLTSQPTGYYYSNSAWTFIQQSQITLVASAAWGRISTDTTDAVEVFTELQFYDVNGRLINNYASDYTGYNVGTEGVVARFVLDYPSLAGTTEPSLANATSDGTLTSGTWTTVPATSGIWETSYGMAWPNLTVAGTTEYVIALLSTGTPAGRTAVTFATDFIDTAHRTHGIVFGYIDSGDFWYATRTSLYQVVSGVETKIDSWTRLNNGDRMVIDAATEIVVYKYKRDGLGSLQILAAPSSGPGDTGAVGYVGLIQKYSSTGAL